MARIIKGRQMTARYWKGREVLKEYKQGRLVYEKQTSIPDYLCFTALEAGTFTLTVPAAVTSTYLSYVEYSLDGINWTRLTVDSTAQSITAGTAQNPIPAGGKVYWRGSGIQYMTGDTRTNNYFSQASYFSSTGRFDVSGNIMSMLYADDFGGKTSFPGTSSQYYNIGAMFQHCTNLVHAKDLLLPAMTLKHLCYVGMFEYCSSLVDAPALPATSVSGANYCYRFMYRYCTSLVEPSDLSHVTDTGRSSFQEMYRGCTSLIETNFPQAATYGQYCCNGMYLGCTSITSADMSYVRTLNGYSCYNLFFGCTNLKYVKCLATDISATDCLTNWLYNVSSTGTFIQAAGVTWPSGASGIPTGWVNIEKRTMPSGYKQVEYVANPNKPSSEGAAYIETGIVLDPSQDTIEIAIFPTFDEDGYIAHYQYGGMPLANNSSPNVATAKVGRFYWLFRKNESTDLIQFSATITSGGSSYVSASNITSNPQVLKVVTSPTSFTLYLNGTQVGTRTGINVDTSDMGTETAKLYGYNSVFYNWIDPIYYMKWWRNGVLIADYVACVRESDNEPSFYDFVSNTFKVPTRTGFFTAGQEI